MSNITQRIVKIIFAASIMLSATACGDTKINNTETLDSNVPVANESSANIHGTDNMDAAPFDESDPYLFNRYIYWNAIEKTEVQLSPSSIHNAKVTNVFCNNGRSIAEFPFGDIPSIIDITYIDFDDGYRVAFDSGYDIERKNAASTEDLEVWDVYEGRHMEYQKKTLLEDGRLHFTVDDRISKIENGTFEGDVHKRISGTAATNDGNTAYILFNSMLYDTAFAEEHLSEFGDSRLTPDTQNAAVETVLRNYDFIKSMLDLWGVKTSGTIWESQQTLTEHFESKDVDKFAHVNEHGFFTVDASFKDTNRNYIPLYAHMSKDGACIELLRGGSDHEIFSS